MIWGNKRLSKSIFLVIFCGTIFFTAKGMEVFFNESTPLLPQGHHSINDQSFDNFSQLEKIQAQLEKTQNPNIRKRFVQAIVKMVSELYRTVDIKKIEHFFKKQPEGILKTTIRLIHQRKIGKLIDSQDIKLINEYIVVKNNNVKLNWACSFVIADILFFLPKLYSLFPYLCEIIPCLYEKPIETLNLQGNMLPELPKEICYLKDLKKINLAHNKFKEFPKALSNLKNLEEIILDQTLENDKNLAEFYLKSPNCKIYFYDSKKN
jgi:hypothetical protein